MDTRALLIWLVGAVAIVVITNDPATILMAIVASFPVGLAGDRPSIFKAFLFLGALALLVRTTLFALTGHTDTATLFHLPEIRFPAFMGSLTLGGSVHADVVWNSLLEGMVLLAVMAIIGAFLASSNTVDLLRMIPSSLFESALVLNIALVFAPQLVKTAGHVRDAQSMRGSRRSVRAYREMLVPILATALERSISLAESMDSRGFGRGIRSHYQRPQIDGNGVGSAAVTLCGAALIFAAIETHMPLPIQWVCAMSIASPGITRLFVGRTAEDCR